MATPRTNGRATTRRRPSPATLKASLRSVKKRARKAKRRVAKAIDELDERDLVAAVRDEVRAKPAAAIGAAVGVGVVTGLLLLRRRRLH